MPELPEVETVARDLRRHLLPDGGAGPVVTGARVAWTGTLRDGDPESFAIGISGRRIVAIGRRGKQLVLDLSGDAFLTIHLKMTGQLFIVPAGAPEDAYVRLALALDDGRELRFRDIRKFGRIGFYRADESPFAELGPEPLDPSFTLRAFRVRLRGRRARLKPLLVDQTFVAGVGNIYADEALWRSRLHPLRSAASVRPDDERRLYRHLREILAEAVERRGSSIDDYTAPDGDGEMQERLDVYQRTGRPCHRCGRQIRRIVLGIRSTHFCSFCQRLPAAERAGAAAVLASMTPQPGRGTVRRGRVPGRRGRRWVELDGPGALGRTRAEAAGVRAANEAEAAARTERTRRAAAARRAAARPEPARSAKAARRPGSSAPPVQQDVVAAARGPSYVGPAAPPAQRHDEEGDRDAVGSPA
jgi:formamidopyrimidine-DNA glycosylase